MSPTEKQINLVDKITSLLKIDFPMSSKDFTKSQYSYFISAYINEYINKYKSYSMIFNIYFDINLILSKMIK